MQEPDCFLRYRINYETLQPCLGCQRAALLRGILRRENRMYTLERAVVLKWFYSLSCRKTFIGVPSSFVGLIFCVTVKHLYRLNIYREPNVIWLRTQCKTCTKLGAVVQLVEYRTRNQEVAGATHTRSTANNLEQVANLLCAQANSASYPQRDGK